MCEADSKTYKGHEIVIEYDENPQSPREDDNICVFHVAHNHYSFGDENYNEYEDIKQAEREAIADGDICLPLYMYEHSGCTIALTPFSCPWDSGQVGFVQVPRKKMIEEFGKKYFTPKLKRLALKWAQNEVETMDIYMRGEIVGYIIDEDGDSCWGYYSIEDAMAEAESIIDYDIKAATKSHFDQLKQWIVNKVPLYVRTTMADALSV